MTIIDPCKTTFVHTVWFENCTSIWFQKQYGNFGEFASTASPCHVAPLISFQKWTCAASDNRWWRGKQPNGITSRHKSWFEEHIFLDSTQWFVYHKSETTINNMIACYKLNDSFTNIASFISRIDLNHEIECLIEYKMIWTRHADQIRIHNMSAISKSMIHMSPLDHSNNILIEISILDG